MKFTMTALATLTLATSASATTLLFDFGRTDTQTNQPPTTPTWNNVVPATTQLFAVFEDGGTAVPGVSFEITDQFFQVGEPTANIGSTNPSGDAGVYPVSATSDPFFGHNAPFAGQDANPYAEVKLSGLDQNMFYDFTFFASRQPVGDNRETQYTVTGAASAQALLNPSNNDTEVVQITDIVPDANGDITVGFESGPNSTSNFYYINVMQVDVRPIPEPASVSLLAAFGGVLALRRRARR